MYVNFKGKSAILYDNYKTVVRRFRAQADIVNAQVSGAGKDAIIALTMKNGKTILYKSDGTVVRR